MIKITRLKTYDDRTIEIEYSDGVTGRFNFEDYFSYQGNLSPLKDLNYFKQAKFEDNILKWNDDIDLCPDIIRAIISNEKIIIDNKIVFDPALKQNAWIE